ncbi:MAG: NFACT family protein [Anaerolineales bacterium]|nr:NFACT family protein [Anaerolineales bacterium]
MHFDALCTACMAQELQRMLCPGRVQQVVMPDAQSLGFEIYANGARRQLLITVNSPLPRLQVVSYKLRRGVEHETPVLLLLRKYARDALLISIVQPVYWERVLYLNFEHRESGATTLVVELLGRQSNLLLMRHDGRILDALRRVAPQQEGQRALLPGAVYALPPAPAKLAPLDHGADDYYTTLESIVHSPGRLWKVLVEHLAGLSPTAARELAWRTTGDAEAAAEGANLLALAEAIQSLWLPTQQGGWHPGIARRGASIEGFAPYELHFLSSFEPAGDLSTALETFVAGLATREPAKVADAYAGQRRAVAALVRKARQRIERQLAALAGDEPAPGEAARLRTNAEWLLAFSSQVEPGQQTLVVPLDEASLLIELDPRKTPFEQADQWFARAAKCERAARWIPQRREQLRRDLEFVEQLAPI